MRYINFVYFDIGFILMEDLSTIQKFRLGDEAALESLILHEGGSVMAFIINYVHQKDLAEDLFQESWIKIWNSKETLSNPSRFRSWMFQIVRHTVIDHLRSKNWKMSIAFSGNEEDLQLIAEDIQSQRDIISKKQLLQIIQAELEKLDSQTQELVTLFYINLLTFKEISQTLNIPYSTVCVKIKRAIAEVKKNVKKKYPESQT